MRKAIAHQRTNHQFTYNATHVNAHNKSHPLYLFQAISPADGPHEKLLAISRALCGAYKPLNFSKQHFLALSLAFGPTKSCL